MMTEITEAMVARAAQAIAGLRYGGRGKLVETNNPTDVRAARAALDAALAKGDVVDSEAEGCFLCAQAQSGVSRADVVGNDIGLCSSHWDSWLARWWMSTPPCAAHLLSDDVSVDRGEGDMSVPSATVPSDG